MGKQGHRGWRGWRLCGCAETLGSESGNHRGDDFCGARHLGRSWEIAATEDEDEQRSKQKESVPGNRSLLHLVLGIVNQKIH